MPTRSPATSRTSRTSPGSASGRGPRAAMRQVYIFSGQSNMSAYSPSGTLRGSSAVLDPSGTHTTPPITVPDYVRTDLNEWTGAPPASVASGTTYDYPTQAGAPCLWNQAVNVGTYYNAWGAYIGDTPTDASGGRVDSSGYGMELPFLYLHLAAYPSTPIAAIKCSAGGSSLAEWSPANTGVNATDADGSQWPVLRGMLAEAAGRLDASGEAWRWGGFVWMQGESGAHSGGTDDSAYLSGARAFFAAVRGLTRPDLPVIVGRIGDNWGWEGGGTTNANPFLKTAGYPWAAIDYSITGDGRVAGSQATRDALRGSAILRRATQVTLGGDANCVWFDNDGYPLRPPFSLTSAVVDYSGYHWGGPGNLAAGERAFAAFQSARN